jgi:hypothetical protein
MLRKKIGLIFIYNFILVEIDWLNSYLKARRQKVVIRNHSSVYCEISAGVPQSSVLGLLLFIIYGLDDKPYQMP